MAQRYDWHVAESPKITQLTGVESHDGTAYASGKRGVLIEAQPDGDWRGITLKGPTGDGHNLNDISITDDGNRVWYCGDSGSFGYWDRARDTIEPHPGPDDHTDGFRGITASGEAGAETVHMVSDVGRVIHAEVDGEALNLQRSVKPSSSTAFTAIVDHDGEKFVSDVAGNLHYTEGGRSWQKKRLSNTTIEALAVGDTGVAAVDDNRVAYRDISLFEEASRTKRARTDVPDPEAITVSGESFVVAGGDGSIVPIDPQGRVVDVDPGPGATFYSVDLQEDGTLLAVGSGGTIVKGTPKA